MVPKIDVVVSPAPDDKGFIAPRKLPSVEDFRERAPEIAESIREIADLMQTRLGDDEVQDPASRWSMDRVTLSFELALEAEAGVVIARASTSATFSIEISWRHSV
jgi:Trypsin-co-occurring domain 1